MNRPTIISSNAPSGGTIDGVDLHDLGVLIHTISSRGMPPITPRRVARPGGHGAIISPEYYTPRPLVISGQMIADTHAELIENQRILTGILSGFYTPTDTFRLTDPVNPDTFYECIYDGACVFQDTAPRTSGRICNFSFNAIANPPWRQALSRSQVRTADISQLEGGIRIDVDGNVPVDYVLTLENPGWQVTLKQGIHVGRFVPAPGLRFETRNGKIAPSDNELSSTPTPSSEGMYLTLPFNRRFRYLFSVPELLSSMSLYTLFRPVAARTLTHFWESVIFFSDDEYGTVVTVGVRNNPADLTMTQWRVQVANQSLFFERPAWETGDLIGLGVNIGDGAEAGVDVYWGGEWVAGHQNSIPPGYTPIAGRSRLILDARQFEAEMLARDLYAVQIFARKLTPEQHRHLHLHPTTPFVEPEEVTLSTPHIAAEIIQFDTEKYQSVDDNSFFPDDGGALLPLSPGPNFITAEHISPSQYLTLNRTLTTDPTNNAPDVFVSASATPYTGVTRFVGIGLGVNAAAINAVSVGDYMSLSWPSGYVAGRITGAKVSTDYGNMREFWFVPIHTRGLSEDGSAAEGGDATVRFLQHNSNHIVGVTLSWRDLYL